MSLDPLLFFFPFFGFFSFHFFLCCLCLVLLWLCLQHELVRKVVFCRSFKQLFAIMPPALSLPPLSCGLPYFHGGMYLQNSLSLSLSLPLLEFFFPFLFFFLGLRIWLCFYCQNGEKEIFFFLWQYQKKKVRNWTFAVYIFQMSLWSIPSSNACFFVCGGVTTTPLFLFFFFPRGQLSFFFFFKNVVYLSIGIIAK